MGKLKTSIPATLNYHSAEGAFRPGTTLSRFPKHRQLAAGHRAISQIVIDQSLVRNSDKYKNLLFPGRDEFPLSAMNLPS